MTEQEEAEFKAASVETYVKEKMKGEGLTEAEAREVAGEPFTKQEGMHLYAVIEALGQGEGKDRRVGWLWLGEKGKGSQRMIYIYDIALEPEHQGKGLGRETLALAEIEGRKLGFDRIGLHVFGHNHRARALYESAGYVTTNINMSKSLA